MKIKIIVVSCLLMVPVTLAFIGSNSTTNAAPKPGPKASAPAIELAEVVQGWIADKKKSEELEKIVNDEFVTTWQRVNIVGVVKGTKKIQVRPKPGLSRKAGKMTLVHKMNYIKKGEKTFEFYVVLPEGEVYRDGDRLKVTDAYIESNRGYGVKYGVRPVLIGGTIEQLPPDY